MHATVDWKNADISAILTKDYETTVLNYRPISLTSVICKVFESIIKDRLISYPIEDLICIEQFGFIQGRSACLQLLNVLEDLTETRQSNTKIIIIYLNYMKAFMLCIMSVCYIKSVCMG